MLMIMRPSFMYASWIALHLVGVQCWEDYDFENTTGLEFVINEYATICYSCVGAPPRFTSYNHTALLDFLKTKDIFVPQHKMECRDKTSLDPATFDGVPIFICDSGLCAKLKGTFAGQPFVVRECWERLWRPQDIQNLENMRDFMIGVSKREACPQPPDAHVDWAEACLCTHDLCNGANIQHLVNCTLVSCLCILLMLKLNVV